MEPNHPAEGRLPDFVVIGAMKGGTTTLHVLLGQHPEVFTTAEKELEFFQDRGNWHRGEAWYRQQFRTARRVCGESSPGYAMWPRVTDVPERMRALVPDAKLIYCVRDPVARAVSHYKHRLAAGVERRAPDEALTDPIYVDPGRYHAQMLRYFEAGWHEDAIHLVQSERLRTERPQVLADLFGLLGVDPGAALEAQGRDLHASRHKRVPTPLGRTVKRRTRAFRERLPWSLRSHVEFALLYPLSRPMPKVVIAEATRERLKEAFAPEAEKLRRETGLRLEGWSV
ncbi:sulfotransferase family protein [Parvularcula dongshanensis]|uniref:Sulfotransferase domain-containing protein n=1 Tax=Parvularcula dongshanensis TaxID=1173995 RepID=A0A840I1N2_9PROT|nr:sulfotransferase [Parvularcula dongshanensis]MBB4658191.1 hypothetical protein [Parvularcula dongshanensis]